MTEVEGIPDGWYAFYKDFKIPARPAELEVARKALADAVTRRETAARNFDEARAKLAAVKSGEAPTITHQQVDELGAAISPAIDAEGAAQAELDRVKSAYSQQVCDALSEPLDRYHFVVAARLQELSDLLVVGAAFRQQARDCGAVLDRRTLELTPHLMTLVNEAKKVLSVGAPKSKAAAA